MNTDRTYWIMLATFTVSSVACVVAIVLYALVPPIVVHPTLGPTCDQTCVEFRTTVIPRVSPDQVYATYGVWLACFFALLTVGRHLNWSGA